MPLQMWPATLGKRIKGRQTDEDGRLLYRLTCAEGLLPCHRRLGRLMLLR